MKKFLLIFALFSPTICFQPTFPSSNLVDIQSVKSIIEIIKLKGLNASIVLSKLEKKNDMAIDLSVSLTLPFNKDGRINAKLSLDECEEFLELAAIDNLAARSMAYKKNQRYGMENSFALSDSNVDRVATILNRGQEKVWVDKNYVSQYTFFSEEEGKKMMGKVIYGNLDIEVTRSQNFIDEEIRASKELLASVYFVYSSNDFGKALVAKFDDAYRNQKWQLVSNVDKRSYIKAKKMIELKMFDTRYLIYSI